MNIGIFSDTYIPEVNGVAHYTDRLRQEFEKRGHVVYLFVPNQKFRFAHDAKNRTWFYPSFRFYGDGRSRVVLPFFRSKGLKNIKLDVIHTQTPAGLGIIGVMTARRRKIPAVHTYHTLFEEYAHYLHLPQKITKPLIRKILRFFIQRHSLITVPSGVVADLLKAQNVTVPIEILPSGIDVERIEKLASKSDPDVVLKRFGLSPDAPFVITTSRLDKEKNIEFLFKALSLVHKKESDIRLVIVGKGTARAYLEQEVTRLGLTGKVIFTGFLSYEDMFALYKRALAFVFASRTETQGYVILEAQTLGLPTIALDAMGTHDMIPDDRGGFLIPEHSCKLFAEYIHLLATDPHLWLQKSREARTHARELSLDHMITRILDLYQSLVK